MEILKVKNIFEKKSSARQKELREKWSNQANKLAYLFAEELGLTKEKYIASLPKFNTQPEEFEGEFDSPIIVETRIPLSRSVRKIFDLLMPEGLKKFRDNRIIEKYFEEDRLIDLRSTHFALSEKPYAVWLQDGSKRLGHSTETACKNIREDSERGATLREGLMLWLSRPDILNSHGLLLSGTRTKDMVNIPIIGSKRWRDEKIEPDIVFARGNTSHSRLGVVTAGIDNRKNIISALINSGFFFK
jgi:hypothetical protein